jgi:hypothetical protein
LNEDTLKLAKDLAQMLAEDVKLASTRIEHVRLTTRANEAALLVQQIEEKLNVYKESSGS